MYFLSFVFIYIIKASFHLHQLKMYCELIKFKYKYSMVIVQCGGLWVNNKYPGETLSHHIFNVIY